jgi:hypothetical protein
MKNNRRLVIITLFLVIITGFHLVFLPSKASATITEYALLTEGASIYSVSSQHVWDLSNGGQIMKDNLLRSAKSSWLSNGETGYIFQNGDSSQTIVLDLGQSRTINKIGANFVAPPYDREVWDYFGVSVSNNGSTFTLVGNLGVKNDGERDVTKTPVYFYLPLLTSVRYIKYEFGQYSPDYGNGGSRVVDLYAQTATPVPIPGALFLFGPGLAGLIAVRRKLRNKRIKILG